MATAFSGDCEKRGTGSSLFGSKKWQERTIRVVRGMLTYSKVGEPHNPKKEHIKLAGYEVIERAAGGLVELTLARQGAKTIFLRVQPEKRDAFVAAFEESGARRRERPQTAAGGGEAGTEGPPFCPPSCAFWHINFWVPDSAAVAGPRPLP